MAKITYATVDEYIAAKPASVRPILKTLRRTLRAAVPKAEERISYQIPAYKLHGGPVFFFAVWAKHYSLYPATGGVTKKFKKELAQYEVSKGTIRFPLDEPVPVALITRMAKFRAAENRASAQGKKKAKT